jgi:hypothetical protein
MGESPNLASAASGTRINRSKELVLEYLNSKIYCFISLGILSIIFIGIVLKLERQQIVSAISFFEISNLTNFVTNLLCHYSLTDLIALSGAFVGIIIAYLYFWHDVSTVYDDPERKNRNRLVAFQLINSFFSNVFWLFILIIYLLVVKASIYETLVVFSVVIVAGLFAHNILITYENVLKKFDSLVLLYGYINAKGDTSEVKTFIPIFIFKKLDIRKNTSDLIFLFTIIVLIFGIIFSFNVLSIFTMELFLIRCFINTAYTNRIPNHFKIKTSEENELDTFVLEEFPDFYRCIIKEDNVDKIKLVVKNTVKKIESL